MLREYFYKKLKILYLEDAEIPAPEIFERFVDGNLEPGSVTRLSNGRTGIVYKIEFRGKTYVLKHDKRERHRFDYLMQSFFRGSNAFRLLKSLSAALEHPLPVGCGVAKIYLVADRRRCFRFVLESFVLMEFVEGREVGAIPDGVKRYGNACERIVRWLHENGIVHGDVHEDNFIANEKNNTVYAIDISGKKPTGAQFAFDRIRLEECFGIKNEQEDFSTFLTKFHIAWREKTRRLKTRIRKLFSKSEP